VSYHDIASARVVALSLSLGPTDGSDAITLDWSV
jgi:hypothetical protein